LFLSLLRSIHVSWRHLLSLTPRISPVYQETIGKGAGASRWQRPVYVDHLPPCNHACPAGENIQAWLALAGDRAR
jgi:hypothetical protein